MLVIIRRSFKITFNSQSYVSVLYKPLPTSIVTIGKCTLFLLLAKILMLKLEKYYTVYWFGRFQSIDQLAYSILIMFFMVLPSLINVYYDQ